ncbi:hypothetical protein H257_00118 [Aphanomyces astaci]|uniref:Uncharacterized protein n=1 Tax=Aphanomyces astaci TaxID=112090 RepID=W4HAI9_APHAT|nr:hypothetical protein H257_00118 [Aphanomyces astaci]ETV88551.1 hypothetical protein H257_00118 [Aphanomyces astaci]|eukprot:XP_009820951.1 hypothetical protein H257_00118 [Aphanomyces astaci]
MSSLKKNTPNVTAPANKSTPTTANARDTKRLPEYFTLLSSLEGSFLPSPMRSASLLLELLVESNATSSTLDSKSASMSAVFLSLSSNSPSFSSGFFRSATGVMAGPVLNAAGVSRT